MNQNYDYLIATAGRLIHKYPYIVAWSRLKNISPKQTRIALTVAEHRRAPKNAIFFDTADNRYYVFDELPALTQSEVEKLLPLSAKPKQGD